MLPATLPQFILHHIWEDVAMKKPRMYQRVQDISLWETEKDNRMAFILCVKITNITRWKIGNRFSYCEAIKGIFYHHTHIFLLNTQSPIHPFLHSIELILFLTPQSFFDNVIFVIGILPAVFMSWNWGRAF